MIHITSVIISGMAKPNLKIKYQTNKKASHKPTKKIETTFVNIPRRRLVFFKWSLKMNKPIGKTANNKMAKTKWIKYCLVKMPINVKRAEENNRNKRHNQPMSSLLIAVNVKIPKAIPLIIKLKLKKELIKPKSLSDPLIQSKPLW